MYMAVQKDTVDPIISIKNGVHRIGKRHFKSYMILNGFNLFLGFLLQALQHICEQPH
jgi:methanogenic corrinoid protein MtbC1